jgi:hypothetical protein
MSNLAVKEINVLRVSGSTSEPAESSLAVLHAEDVRKDPEISPSVVVLEEDESCVEIEELEKYVFEKNRLLYDRLSR